MHWSFSLLELSNLQWVKQQTQTVFLPCCWGFFCGFFFFFIRMRVSFSYYFFSVVFNFWTGYRQTGIIFVYLTVTKNPLFSYGMLKVFPVVNLLNTVAWVTMLSLAITQLEVCKKWLERVLEKSCFGVHHWISTLPSFFWVGLWWNYILEK